MLCCNIPGDSCFLVFMLCYIPAYLITLLLGDAVWSKPLVRMLRLQSMAAWTSSSQSADAQLSLEPRGVEAES